MKRNALSTTVMKGVSALKHPDKPAIFHQNPKSVSFSPTKNLQENINLLPKPPSSELQLPPRPSAKLPTIPLLPPPLTSQKPSLQNRIGLEMDNNLLGKFSVSDSLLEKQLPEPQSAPPNIYGEFYKQRSTARSID